MNTNFMQLKITRLLCSLTLLSIVVSQASADPLPGRDKLKFSQLPMRATTIPSDNGTVTTYGGHDELSTAYGFGATPPPNQIPIYQGRFMADDFADNFNSPVVHVKWWGSYLDDFINPNMPVDKFLISFESDIPANTADPNSFSRPGQPLLNQVVRRGPLSPGSGTFTEKTIRGPDPVVHESLYEYNAELHLDKAFPEKADTVYWLKIVALVDVPAGIQFDPFQPGATPVPVTQWGWHNRDYTIQDTLASPNVFPGERIVGKIGSVAQPTDIWHFQDDAVTGNVIVDPAGPGGLKMPVVSQPQDMMHPTNYLDFADGPGAIPGTNLGGIGRFSKDLAFQLYTTIPEPSSCLLLLVSLCGLATRRR